MSGLWTDSQNCVQATQYIFLNLMLSSTRFFVRCSFYLNLASRVIPRYFAVLAYEDFVPLMKIGCCLILLFVKSIQQLRWWQIIQKRRSAFNILSVPRRYMTISRRFDPSRWWGLKMETVKCGHELHVNQIRERLRWRGSVASASYRASHNIKLMLSLPLSLSIYVHSHVPGRVTWIKRTWIRIGTDPIRWRLKSLGTPENW
jgi:hypothetical protein